MAHRDYFEKGANVMVEIFDDRIEITNPGGLVKGLRPEDFGTKSVLRNPNIAALLHRVDYIEKMGTGINKIRLLIKDAKLPPPKFEFGTFFTVRFERPIIERLNIDSERVNTNFGARFGLKGKRLDRIVRILEMLYQGEILTAPRVSSLLQVPLRTTKSDFQFLRKIELVAFEGPLKVGKYVLTQKGHKAMKELVS